MGWERPHGEEGWRILEAPSSPKLCRGAEHLYMGILSGHNRPDMRCQPLLSGGRLGHYLPPRNHQFDTLKAGLSGRGHNWFNVSLQSSVCWENERTGHCDGAVRIRACCLDHPLKRKNQIAARIEARAHPPTTKICKPQAIGAYLISN